MPTRAGGLRFDGLPFTAPSNGADILRGHRWEFAVGEGDQSKGGGPDKAQAPVPPVGAGLDVLRLDGVLLLDAVGNDPVAIEAITFADEGIGVIRSPGDGPRVLPWSFVSAHVVERWAGGVIPEWWVDPQLNRADGGDRQVAAAVPHPGGASRVLPHAEPGAVIAVRTPFGTYRFLHPGADPNDLSNRITDFAVRHQGLAGVPSVTTVARPRRGNDRRQGSRSSHTTSSSWSKVQPYLVVALILLIGTAVTLILLQSAGVIHLPYLGGTSPGTVRPIRTR